MPSAKKPKPKAEEIPTGAKKRHQSDEVYDEAYGSASVACSILSASASVVGSI